MARASERRPKRGDRVRWNGSSCHQPPRYYSGTVVDVRGQLAFVEDDEWHCTSGVRLDKLEELDDGEKSEKLYVLQEAGAKPRVFRSLARAVDAAVDRSMYASVMDEMLQDQSAGDKDWTLDAVEIEE